MEEIFFNGRNSPKFLHEKAVNDLRSGNQQGEEGVPVSGQQTGLCFGNPCSRGLSSVSSRSGAGLGWADAGTWACCARLGACSLPCTGVTSSLLHLFSLQPCRHARCLEGKQPQPVPPGRARGMGTSGTRCCADRGGGIWAGGAGFVAGALPREHLK